MTVAKKKSKTSSGNLVPILIVVVVVLAFGFGLLWQKVQDLETGTSNNNNVRVANTDTGSPQVAPPLPEVGEVAPVTDEDYVKGNRNARIALIEYSDTECPFCKRFHPTAQQAVDEYPNDVMWVYRHFPLDSIHSKARKQAEAAECAGKLAGNDGFWLLMDKIFEVTPSNNGLDNSILPDLAAEVGLDSAAIANCIDSGEMAANVEADFQSGTKAGVTGTPGNILLDTKTGETQLIPGAVPFAQLQQAIDAMLAS